MSRTSVSGQYAGPVSRAAAAAIDVGVVLASYSLGVGIVGFLAQALLDVSLEDGTGLVATLALLSWGAVYVVTGTAVTGRTIGKAVVGLKVVARDGRPVRPRACVVRVLVLPLSTSFFAIGALLIVLRRDHRALHDLIARTAVVYDWGDRSAQLPGPLAAYLQARTGA